jgi:hypothetical protein
MGFLQKLFGATGAHTAKGTLSGADISSIIGGDLDVVGESRYEASFKQLLSDTELKVSGGTEKFLAGRIVHEPFNKFDKNAIQVFAGGVLVGYVPTETAKRLAPKLAASGGAADLTVRVWGRYDKRRSVFASARIELPRT